MKLYSVIILFILQLTFIQSTIAQVDATCPVNQSLQPFDHSNIAVTENSPTEFQATANRFGIQFDFTITCDNPLASTPLFGPSNQGGGAQL